ncbi:MAG: hypothetical protein JXR23_10030 [Pontiellaceae bacterium]|nr:hypothetical protein [Pontiellaceae bacterium]
MRSRLLLLCRGEATPLSRWLDKPEQKWFLCCILTITLGTGVYGITIGLWRGPLMAAYVAIKFPLLIFLTTLCNAGLNGMLALVMGAGISFRQTLLAQLMSYTVAALILASMAPITLFILFNTPPHSSEDPFGHHLFLLLNVVILAGAGMVANGRLYQLLLLKTPHRSIALRVLAAWLAGNLFVGAQLSWNLRPFIGSAHLKIQFLRPNPFEGNFYESVYTTASELINGAAETPRKME